MLPDHWSIGLLSHFLKHSLRHSLHMRRALQLERAISRLENVDVKHDRLRATRGAIYMSDDR